MSDKNIDKDIEIVKKIKYIELTGNIDGKFIRAELPKHYLQAIENVLSELEELRKYDIRKIDFKDEHIENMMAKLEYIKTCGDKKELWNYEAGFILNVLRKDRVELETWKKIAEKLAELINNHDIDEDVCRQMGKDFDCTLFNQDEKFCVQCIIDWARNEVEKNAKN